MQQQFFSIGIDIGGTNTSIGLVNCDGKILEEEYIKTRDYIHPDDFIEGIKEKLLPIFQKYGKENILGIGIGAPNGNFYTGNIELAANLPWEGIIPLKSKIENAFSLPTTITNDANAAAIGEMVYGATKDVQDFIMITLGTGVGSGFVANGKLIYGNDGFAGELGHVIAVRNGRPCGCGRRGCLETYASATGIVTTAIEFLQQEEKKMDTSIPKGYLLNLWRTNKMVSSKDIFNAARLGDPVAIEIFNFTGVILGQTLADAVAITSPKVIVFFGGLSLAGDLIIRPTKESMEENLLSIFKNKVNLISSELNNQNAAILGASALVFHTK